MNAEKKSILVAARVTLNGRPAVIAGKSLKFANVCTLCGTLRAEYSWEACERIVLAGGNFKL